MLTYYLLANVSAWTLTSDERRSPQWLAGLGVGLCALLAITLPLTAVAGGAALLTTGSLIWLTMHRPSKTNPPTHSA